MKKNDDNAVKRNPPMNPPVLLPNRSPAKTIMYIQQLPIRNVKANYSRNIDESILSNCTKHHLLMGISLHSYFLIHCPFMSLTSAKAIFPFVHQISSRSSVYLTPDADITCGNVYSLPLGRVTLTKSRLRSDNIKYLAMIRSPRSLSYITGVPPHTVSATGFLFPTHPHNNTPSKLIKTMIR